MIYNLIQLSITVTSPPLSGEEAEHSSAAAALGVNFALFLGNVPALRAPDAILLVSELNKYNHSEINSYLGVRVRKEKMRK